MAYTVTCNGKPWKVSNSRNDCERFIAMQKRKLRGAGLISENDGESVDRKRLAYATTCQWAIRLHQPVDDRALWEVELPPLTPEIKRACGIRG